MNWVLIVIYAMIILAGLLLLLVLVAEITHKPQNPHR